MTKNRFPPKPLQVLGVFFFFCFVLSAALFGQHPNLEGNFPTGPMSYLGFHGTTMPWIDVHCHLFATFPTVKGLIIEMQKALQTAVREMDRYGIKKMLIMPPPLSPGQKDVYTYQELMLAIKRFPDRFGVLGGGCLLNPLIQKTMKEKRVSEAIRRQFETYARGVITTGALGFGEMEAEIFSLAPEGRQYRAAPPNHPLFLLLSDIAFEYNVPIDLHMEALDSPDGQAKDPQYPRAGVMNPLYVPRRERFIPKEPQVGVNVEGVPKMDRLFGETPANFSGGMHLNGDYSSFYKNTPNPVILRSKVRDFEKLLEHNPRTIIIWSHLGWDNTELKYPDLIAQLLAKHPNLFLSFKISPGNCFPPNCPLTSGGELRREWISLIREYSDRFMIGSDQFFAPSGSVPPGPPSLEPTHRFLSLLPPELSWKIGYENPVRIFKLFH